jgi:SAM-dependent methyltransferase
LRVVEGDAQAFNAQDRLAHTLLATGTISLTKRWPMRKWITERPRSMSILRDIFLRMFGLPQGVIGRLGGTIMARTNQKCGAWVTHLLEIGPSENVLEVGFGPGVVVQRLSNLAAHIAGIDPSQEMVRQARARNAKAIAGGRVDLRRGSVERLPFDSNTFDKAVAINSMQVWPDPVAGLREISRVMRPGGKIGLGFTRYSGQPNEGLTETLIAAGFTEARIVWKDTDFCALAVRP